MTVIGTSGFEYTTITTGTIINTTVKNIKTGNTIITLKGGYRWRGRGTGARREDYTDAEKFLGMDDRYYYINSEGDWGQIQSDGSVLRANRTILTTLAFYPMYKVPVIKEPPILPVPVTTVKSIPAVIPKAPITPLMDVVKTGDDYPTRGNEWLKEINQMIDQLNNQIHQMIQSVLNLLKLNK